MKTKAILGVFVLIVLAGCTSISLEDVRLLAASFSSGDELAGPLGGQVSALPTPVPARTTPTPPPSSVTFPTPAPTAVGPLATLTAIAGMLPTMDLNATPYTVAYRGVPVFIEFQARW